MRLRSLVSVPRERLVLGGILLVALALRVWDLGARSLWFDEATEYWVATSSLADLGRHVSEGTGDPPLYTFLLHLWMKLGSGEAYLRSLSLIASMLGVAGMMVLGRRLGGFAAAAATGALAALNPADIRYAQEVGQYAFLIGTVAWNLVAMHGLWHQGGRKWVIAWALTAFLATNAYYAAVFPVLVPFGCAVVESSVRRDGAKLRRLAGAFGLYVAAATGVLWSILPEQMGRVLDTRAAIAEYPQQRPEGIALVWRWLGNLFAFQFAAWPYTRVPDWLPIVGWFATAALVPLARRRWTAWFAATWAVYGVAGLLELFPFGFRWGLILWPFVAAFAGAGVALALKRRWLKLPALAAFASLLAVGLVSLPNLTVRDWIDPSRSFHWPETEDMRPVVDYWFEHSTDDQPTYVFYGAAPAFAYYAQRYPATRGDLPPTWNLKCWHDADPPAYCRENNIHYGRWLRAMKSPEERGKSIFATLGARPREFWIVFSHVYGTESIEIVQRIELNGYRKVGLVERRAAAALLMRLQ